MKDIAMLRRKQVERITGLSRSSIYCMMEKNEFPRPIKLSERSVAWVYDEIQAWLNDKITSSRRFALNE